MGPPFTWSNGTPVKGSIFKRLDRCLVSTECNDLFPFLTSPSDHCPLLLDLFPNEGFGDSREAPEKCLLQDRTPRRISVPKVEQLLLWNGHRVLGLKPKQPIDGGEVPMLKRLTISEGLGG